MLKKRVRQKLQVTEGREHILLGDVGFMENKASGFLSRCKKLMEERKVRPKPEIGLGEESTARRVRTPRTVRPQSEGK